MEHKMLQLQPRLQLLADLVPQGARLADIGTDHGYIPVYLLQRAHIASAIAADVGREPLQHAVRTAEEYGVDGIDFRLCDGLAAIEKEETDCVVIAGMGGSTIAHILRDGMEKIRPARLLLQPNVALAEVRRTLCELNYRINDERLVQAAGRFYTIISAVPGHAVYDETQLAIGPVILEKRPPELAAYAAFKVRVARKALAGAQKSERDVQQTFLDEIRLWEPLMTND